MILGAYLLYTRLHPSSAATGGASADATPTPDSSGSSGSQVPASGQGTPADNLSGSLLDALGANTSSIDALTSQLLGSYALTYDMGDAPAAGSPAPTSAPASQPSTPAAHPAAAGAPPAQHATQTQAGKLSWGGTTFTTKAAFDSWARAHGSSTAAELNNHPQAKAIYSTLK